MAAKASIYRPALTSRVSQNVDARDPGDAAPPRDYGDPEQRSFINAEQGVRLFREGEAKSDAAQDIHADGKPLIDPAISNNHTAPF